MSLQSLEPAVRRLFIDPPVSSTLDYNVDTDLWLPQGDRRAGILGRVMPTWGLFRTGSWTETPSPPVSAQYPAKKISGAGN